LAAAAEVAAAVAVAVETITSLVCFPIENCKKYIFTVRINSNKFTVNHGSRDVKR